MCIASPARVVALEGGDAIVDIGGRIRRASVLMTPDVEVGASVLVAAGNVVRRIDEAEARELERELGRAMRAAASQPTNPRQDENDRGGPR